MYDKGVGRRTVVGEQCEDGIPDEDKIEMIGSTDRHQLRTVSIKAHGLHLPSLYQSTGGGV